MILELVVKMILLQFGFIFAKLLAKLTECSLQEAVARISAFYHGADVPRCFE